MQLYVAGLSDETVADELRELLSRFGRAVYFVLETGMRLRDITQPVKC